MIRLLLEKKRYLHVRVTPGARFFSFQISPSRATKLFCLVSFVLGRAHSRAAALFQMTSCMRGTVLKNRKLVVVGDGMAGKTCLLYAFKYDNFDASHPPTIFETYAADIELDGKTVSPRAMTDGTTAWWVCAFYCQFNLALFDTAGQEVYARLRPLSYPGTDVVLICFSVDNPASVDNVIEEWNPEVRHFCATCPVILVACKLDLRTDPETIEELKRQGSEPVSNETGRQIAAKIKANAYMECSAKTREGVRDLFLHAARLSIEKRSNRQPRRFCVLH